MPGGAGGPLSPVALAGGGVSSVPFRAGMSGRAGGVGGASCTSAKLLLLPPGGNIGGGSAATPGGCATTPEKLIVNCN